MKHTPTPWSVNCSGIHHNNPKLANLEITYGNDGECIADTVYKMEDAEHIVKCVNMHDELVRIAGEYQAVLNGLKTYNTLNITDSTIQNIDKGIRELLKKEGENNE